MVKSSTTIEVDRDVARAAKVCAAQEGITLKAYVERAMLAYATRWPKPKGPKATLPVKLASPGRARP